MAEFCTRCGASLGSGVRFCRSCGAAATLPKGPSAPAAIAPTPAPAAAPAAPPPPYPRQPVWPYLTVGFSMGFILLCIAAAAGLLYLDSNKLVLSIELAEWVPF